MADARRASAPPTGSPYNSLCTAAFRDAWKAGHRCLVVTDGFYEWRKPDKQPFAICVKDDLTVMAELWSLWRSPAGEKATIRSRLMALKAFFQWLSDKPGYKSRISYSDAEYFNPTVNNERIGAAHRPGRIPSLDEIRRVIACMPAGTDIEKRDRALSGRSGSRTICLID